MGAIRLGGAAVLAQVLQLGVPLRQLGLRNNKVGALGLEKMFSLFHDLGLSRLTRQKNANERDANYWDFLEDHSVRA